LLRSNTKGYGGKLTRLAHKTVTQLHLVDENSTICSSRATGPVRNLLDTPSYIHAATRGTITLFQYTLHPYGSK